MARASVMFTSDDDVADRDGTAAGWLVDVLGGGQLDEPAVGAGAGVSRLHGQLAADGQVRSLHPERNVACRTATDF